MTYRVISYKGTVKGLMEYLKQLIEDEKKGSFIFKNTKRINLNKNY